MFLPTSNSSNLVFLYLVSTCDWRWLVCLSGEMAGYPVSAGSHHCSDSRSYRRPSGRLQAVCRPSAVDKARRSEAKRRIADMRRFASLFGELLLYQHQRIVTMTKGHGVSTSQLHYFMLLCYARKVGTSANSALIRYYLPRLKLSSSTLA